MKFWDIVILCTFLFLSELQAASKPTPCGPTEFDSTPILAHEQITAEAKLQLIGTINPRPNSIAQEFPEAIQALLKIPIGQIDGFKNFKTEILMHKRAITVGEALDNIDRFGRNYQKIITGVLARHIDIQSLQSISEVFDLNSPTVSKIARYEAHSNPRVIRTGTPRKLIYSEKTEQLLVYDHPEILKQIKGDAAVFPSHLAELMIGFHSGEVIGHRVFGYELHETLSNHKLQKLPAQLQLNEIEQVTEYDLLVKNWHSSSNETKPHDLAFIEVKSRSNEIDYDKWMHRNRIEKWIARLKRQRKILEKLGVNAHQVLWTLGSIGEKAEAHIKSELPGIEIIHQ